MAQLSPEGYIALQLILDHGRLAILQMLLGVPDAGTDGLHSRSGATKLTMAVMNRFAEAVPPLLAYPLVAPNRLDTTGRAASHHAVLRPEQNEPVVKLLLAYSRVDKTIISSDSRTALASV